MSSSTLTDTSSIMLRVPVRSTTWEYHKPTSNPVPVRSIYLVYPPPAQYDPKPPIRIDPHYKSVKPSELIVAESKDTSNYLHERSALMLRKEYQRFHQNWSRYYYGTNEEQESYRKYIREGLKQQMLDKAIRKKNEWQTKSQDYKEIDEKCRAFDMKQAMTMTNRRLFLQQFRDANKKMIEEREVTRKIEKQNSICSEKELLRYNPINWSHTLK